MSGNKFTTRLRRSCVVVTVALVAVLALSLSAPPAAAAAEDPVREIGRTYATPLALVALVTLAGAAFVPSLGQKNRTWMAVGGIVAGGILVVANVGNLGGGGGNGVCDDDPSTSLPDCEPAANVEWNVRIATTYDTDVDADTEVLDSEGFTACDGGTPDLNGEIATLGTNAIIDQSTGTVSYQSDMDQDLVRTAVAFQEIDCPILPFSIALVGTIDVDGNGADDSVTWKAKLQSLGPSEFTDGNQSSRNVLFYDGDSGWECAFLTEGNIWVSAFGDQKYASSAPSSGPWIALGSHAGAGAAFDTGSFACVFNTPDGAPVGYTNPPTAGNVEWSATILVGSETNHKQLTANWVLFTRA